MSGHFLISATIIHVISLETSKFEWTRNNRIDKIILVPIWAIYIYMCIYIYIYICIYIYIFFEVSALLDVRHCPNLQSCAISRKTNDENLRKWKKF